MAWHTKNPTDEIQIVVYYESWQSYALDYIHIETSLAADEVSEHNVIGLKPQTYVHVASRQAQPASPSCNKLSIELLRRLLQYQRGLGKILFPNKSSYSKEE